MKIIESCEVCGSNNLHTVLDLGNHPLCDDLIPTKEEIKCMEYPITILYCKNCKTAHQKFQVEKKTLFPQVYHYRSRFTNDVLNGMKLLVENIINHTGSINNKKVLDIGCNDGSLLNFFSQNGAITLGVEPTGAFEDIDTLKHVAYNNYFDSNIAYEIMERHGKVDIITFTNVFAHIEDLNGLIDSLKIVMHKNTIVVIENHYLGSVLEKNQFDTFYHEHPRTYSLHSFKEIAKKLSLKITKYQFTNRYGGNIQVILSNQQESNLFDLSKKIKDEESFDFDKLNQHVDNWKESKKKELIDAYNTFGRLKAKAFPGRAAILVKCLQLDENIIEAVYEKPGSPKIGHYVPGTRIPIKSDEELFNTLSEEKCIVNFAWHIEKEITSYLRDKGFKNKILNIH
jgi:hypothetical protein